MHGNPRVPLIPRNGGVGASMTGAGADAEPQVPLLRKGENGLATPQSALPAGSTRPSPPVPPIGSSEAIP
jgi:hypothetical protein